MLASFRTPLFAALVSLGAAFAPGQASSAPALLGAASEAMVSTAPAQNLVQQVSGISFYYSSRRHGPRYRVVRPGYRYFHSGYYYRRPYWTPGYVYNRPVYRDPFEYRTYRTYRTRPSVSFGVTIGSPRVVRGGRSAHVAWCRDRYRTYDVRSDTFIARAGHPRVRCRSPF